MLSRFRNSFRITCRNYADYVQGQSPEPRVREYFYYIDHQGMVAGDKGVQNYLFKFGVIWFSSLKMACGQNLHVIFVGKLSLTRRPVLYYADLVGVHRRLSHALKNLEHPRLKRNDTGRYDKDFPYLSICGRERNFVRCDDLPIVFTHVLQKKSNELVEDWFSYAHAGDSLVVPFEPEKLCMSVTSGRVYHPASQKLGGIGLVRSKLAIEFSRLFDFENGEENNPTHFNWNGKRHCLNDQWHRTTVLGQK